jgi:hypothetical protein
MTINRIPTDMIVDRQSGQKLDAQMVDNAKQITDRIISAKDKQFGAKGDGITDDTTAIQSFVNYVVNNHLEGVIPAGTYLISNEITFPSLWGWKLKGAGVAVTTIKQNTDNTPIFRFLSTPSLVHSIQLRGMSFDYTNSQPSTNTNSFPIKLETMVYESTFDELGFNKGTYGIYVTDTTQNPWGMTFDNLRFNNGLTVGAIRMSTLNAVPNNRFGRIFCDCANMIGPVFILKGYNSIINTIEFIAANQGAKLIYMQAGAKFEIGTLKLENGIYNSATSSSNIFEFSPSCFIHIGTVTVTGDQNMTINPILGGVYVIRSTGGSPTAKITIGHMELNGTSITNGYAFGGVGNTTLQTINIINTSWALTNVGSDAASENVIVLDYLNGRLSQNKGDNAYTVTLGDPNQISFETALTAPRTVTLPSVNNNLFNGLKYRIRSYGAVNGTNVINIVCNGVTKATLSTDKTMVELTYRRNAVSAQNGWTVTDFSTLP